MSAFEKYAREVVSKTKLKNQDRFIYALALFLANDPEIPKQARK